MFALTLTRVFFTFACSGIPPGTVVLVIILVTRLEKLSFRTVLVAMTIIRVQKLAWSAFFVVAYLLWLSLACASLLAHALTYDLAARSVHQVVTKFLSRTPWTTATLTGFRSEVIVVITARATSISWSRTRATLTATSASKIHWIYLIFVHLHFSFSCSCLGFRKEKGKGYR